MGLFSNKKKPCPVCGNPTPRLLPDTIEGMPICKECARKNTLPFKRTEHMTVEDFKQFLLYQQENQPLRDRFEETYAWYDNISMDVPKRLFRFGSQKEGLVMEASCIRSFRILEGDNLLFESSPEGLKCYETNVPARIQAAGPAISQFKIQYEQFRQLERMQEAAKKDGDSQNLTYLSRPTFEYEVVRDLRLELTLDHPYWGGTEPWFGDKPEFDDTYPSMDDFLRKFKQEMKKLHELAVNLMIMMELEPKEIQMGVPGMPTVSAVPTAPADPVAEIQKYKGLLDSGVITEDEFAAKKRQLLGI